MKYRGRTEGFTLIELLVVIAIIGLLASIILASLNTAQQKGRDSKRLADIQDLQGALQLYDQTCRSYPNSLSVSANNGCPSGVTLASFISPIPTDPRSGTNYLYVAFGSGSICTSYHLGADLEVAETVGYDVSPSSASKCTGGAYLGTSSNGISTISGTNGDFSPEGSAGAWVYDVTGS
jgi:type II secretion system protein G